MSKCSKCEAELPDGAHFCNKCGSPQLDAASVDEETPKTTPAETPIVVPLDTIQPDTRPTPPSHAVSDNGKKETLPKENGTDVVAEETQSLAVPSEPSHPGNGTDIVAEETQSLAVPSEPLQSGNVPDAMAQIDTSQSASGSNASPDQQEQKRLEAIAMTPTQIVKEPTPRKAGPGLIRPIGTAASPKSSSIPKTSIPRRPGQSVQPPMTPVPPRQAQGIAKPPATPPTGYLQNGRHLADQETQQEPAVSPPAAGRSQEVRSPLREKVTSDSTSPVRLDTPIENRPTGHVPSGLVWAKPEMVHPSETSEWSEEHLDATQRAAEHWRTSWRDRQRAEAGPIMDVSRGDASVAMPLMSMQHSFIRLRAIVTTMKEKQPSRGKNLMFWIALILMICLIGGLGVYIFSTYLPNSSFGGTHSSSLVNTQPTLAIQESQSPMIRPGQTVHLHGEHFGANDTISFFLDTTMPITDANGKLLTAQATGEGIFDVSLFVGKNWLAGPHLISAQDNRTEENAYLNIQVGIAGTPVTSSNNLALSVSELKFKVVNGQGYPGQRVTLTNTSGAVLHWTALAIVENNLSWLIIDDNQTSGSLNSNVTDSIGISVLPTGLKSSPTPYKGQIVFTINGKEQLTLPVELQVVDAQAEIISSPNPLTGLVNTANSTCKSGTTFTLINLGSAVITWTIKPDTSAQSHISFLLGGTSVTTGQLEPSGIAGDTQVITLRCTNVHAGDTYHSMLYANNLQWPLVVLIRTST